MFEQAHNPAPTDQLKPQITEGYEHTPLKQGESTEVPFDGAVINAEDFGIPQKEGYDLNLGGVVVIDPREQDGGGHAVALGSHEEKGNPATRKAIIMGLVRDEKGAWRHAGTVVANSGTKATIGRAGNAAKGHFTDDTGRAIVSSTDLFGGNLPLSVSRGHIQLEVTGDGFRIDQTGQNASEVLRKSPEPEIVEVTTLEDRQDTVRAGGAAALKAALAEIATNRKPTEAQRPLTTTELAGKLKAAVEAAKHEPTPEPEAGSSIDVAGLESRQANFVRKTAEALTSADQKLERLAKLIGPADADAQAELQQNFQIIEAVRQQVASGDVYAAQGMLGYVEGLQRNLDEQVTRWQQKAAQAEGHADDGQAEGAVIDQAGAEMLNGADGVANRDSSNGKLNAISTDTRSTLAGIAPAVVGIVQACGQMGSFANEAYGSVSVIGQYIRNGEPGRAAGEIERVLASLNTQGQVISNMSRHIQTLREAKQRLNDAKAALGDS